MINFLKHLARILFGIVFIFSGFTKGIDPWGATYKFIDYFQVLNLSFLDNLAFLLAVLQAFAEFAIGVAFLFNWKMRFFAWPGLFFMMIFTPLTLWIALKNPVTDCGCFGDALIISNWATFYKNTALALFGIVVFVNRRWFEKRIKSRYPFILSILTFIAYFVFAWYSYNHLPVIDFRPYKIGTNIPEAMSVPPDAEQDVYKNTFYYKNRKTGKIKKFNEDNYPWKDTLNWAYNNAESVLIQKGYEPPIHDFMIESADGDNVLDYFINSENNDYLFILVAYDLYKSSTKTQSKINTLANWSIHQDISFICLTSTLSGECTTFAQKNDAPYEFFNCDEITLKTIVRSNPGLVLIQKGIIKAKWHYNDIPSPEEFWDKYLSTDENKTSGK